MRKLDIYRRKRFYGCAGTYKIYTPDPNGDTEILGTVCTRIGTLKNGAHFTTDIPDTEFKIFIIADNISRSYCSEVYTVPAGTEDVFLTGAASGNFSDSNAFRLDGVDNEETLNNRKSGKKRGKNVFVTAIIIGAVIGLFAGIFTGIKVNKGNREKVFTVDSLSITLSSNFKQTAVADFDACYSSDTQAVFVIKDDISEVPELSHLSAQEYLNLVHDANTDRPNITDITDDGGIEYFTYTYNSDDGEYIYYTTAFKGSTAFYTVQVVGLNTDIETMLTEFTKYASTVSVK